MQLARRVFHLDMVTLIVWPSNQHAVPRWIQGSRMYSLPALFPAMATGDSQWLVLWCLLSLSVLPMVTFVLASFKPPGGFSKKSLDLDTEALDLKRYLPKESRFCCDSQKPSRLLRPLCANDYTAAAQTQSIPSTCTLN
eukprot:917884-Prorocentrum_minimum.AAC.2